MRKPSPNRGKAGAVTNFFLLSASIVGLSVYFTVNKMWNIGTIAVIVFLVPVAAFYFWLWRFNFK